MLVVFQRLAFKRRMLVVYQRLANVIRRRFLELRYLILQSLYFSQILCFLFFHSELQFLELVPQFLILSLQLFHLLGIAFNLRVLYGNLVLENGNNGECFLEEFVFEKLCFEARLSLAEVLDETEEVEDFGGAGLNLRGGA